MYALRVSDAPPDIDPLVAWMIKGLQKQGKTQTGLAQALKIAQPRIVEIKAGKRRIHSHEIPKIAEYIEEPPPGQWLPVIPTADPDYPPRTPRPIFHFSLHDDPNLVHVIVLRNDRIIAEFDADRSDLELLNKQTLRALQTFPKPK